MPADTHGLQTACVLCPFILHHAHCMLAYHVPHSLHRTLCAPPLSCSVRATNERAKHRSKNMLPARSTNRCAAMTCTCCHTAYTCITMCTHTFSAPGLRSSVVSVLYRLTTITWRNAPVTVNSTVWTGAPKPPPACWMACARVLLALHSLHASAQPSYLHRGSHTFKTCKATSHKQNLAAHDALPADAVAYAQLMP